MLKKGILAAAVLLLIFGVCLPLQAEEGLGEICCWLRFGDETISGGSLQICQVGIPVPEGYRLKDEYGGGIIAGEDVPSLSFALWMAQRAEGGYLKKPTRNGLVRFANLEPGMYLIRQGEDSPGFYPIDPYLACVSQELPVIDTYPELSLRSDIPRTGDSPSLILGILGMGLSFGGLCLCRGKKQNI